MLPQAVESYDSNCTMTILLNNLDFLIVPVVNVDGYIYSWTMVSIRISLDDTK